MTFDRGRRSGGGDSRIETSIGRFDDLAALNVFGAANLSQLHNSASQVTVATVGAAGSSDVIVYGWAGEDTPSAYPSGGRWSPRVLRGPAGTNGTSGIQNSFSSAADVDTYFSQSANFLLLQAQGTGFPILVKVADEAAEMWVWGPPQTLPSYSNVYWRVASPRSGASSFEWSNKFILGSSGNQLYLLDMAPNSSGYRPLYSPVAQLVGDHSEAAGRVVGSAPFSAAYTELNDAVFGGDDPATPGDPRPPIKLGGDAAASGSVAFNVNFDIQNVNTALYGLVYIPEEAYTGRLEYRITDTANDDDDGNDIVPFRSVIADVSLTQGAEFEQWFTIPIDTRIGDQLNARLIKSDGTNLLVRPEAGDPTRPYSATQLRGYSDDPVFVASQFISQFMGKVVADDNIEFDITTTPGMLRLKATNNYITGASLEAGNILTLTREGLTDVTVDLSSLAGGGGNPSTVSTDLRHGLSDQSNPALVVFSGLTDVPTPTDPITLQTGLTTDGQYYHIFTSNTHEIVQILDTVLSQVVYQRGGSAQANIFSLTEDARTEGGITYDALTIGPLNAGIDEGYEVRFS